MTETRIFVSRPSFDPMADFLHNGRRLTFLPLASEGWMQALNPDCWVFVDLLMADFSGLEMCRRLRADQTKRPARIVVILEEDDIDLRRRALAAGADDYIVAPVDRMRLLDRILSSEGDLDALRAHRVVQVGGLTVNVEAMRADWMGNPIVLPLKEFRLLLLLAENPSRVMTRQEIIAGLGQTDDLIDTRTVDVWIGRLRSALRSAGAANVLRTVRQIGYALDLD